MICAQTHVFKCKKIPIPRERHRLFLKKNQHACQVRREAELGVQGGRSPIALSQVSGSLSQLLKTPQLQNPPNLSIPGGHPLATTRRAGRRDLPGLRQSRFCCVPSRLQACRLASHALNDPSWGLHLALSYQDTLQVLQVLLSCSTRKLAGSRKSTALLQAGFPLQTTSKLSLL